MNLTNAAPQLYQTGHRLWTEWTQMWNGKPELARTLVADRFVLHMTTPTPVDLERIITPADVERWVISHRGHHRTLTFHFDCGPFVDVNAGVVSGPWWADASLDGSPRIVCGTDMVGFRDGKVTEYWTIAKEVDTVGRWVSQMTGNDLFLSRK